MANACIASGAANLANAAIFTASSAELFAPASMLLTRHVEEQWIGLGEAGDWLRADLLGLQTFDTIAIMGLAGTSFRLRVSSADPLAGDLLDTGAGSPVAIDQEYLQHRHLFSSPVSARYLQFDFAGAPAAAGKAFIGTRTQFERNFVYGASEQYVDPSLKERASGAQIHIFPKAGWRAFDLTFAATTRAQARGIVTEIDRNCGKRNDVLLILDPESDHPARDFIWGPIVDVTPIVSASPNTASKQYQIEQRR